MYVTFRNLSLFLYFPTIKKKLFCFYKKVFFGSFPQPANANAIKLVCTCIEHKKVLIEHFGEEAKLSSFSAIMLTN